MNPSDSEDQKKNQRFTASMT